MIAKIVDTVKGTAGFFKGIAKKIIRKSERKKSFGINLLLLSEDQFCYPLWGKYETIPEIKSLSITPLIFRRGLEQRLSPLCYVFRIGRQTVEKIQTPAGVGQRKIEKKQKYN